MVLNNSHYHHCSNITGAVSDLCSIISGNGTGSFNVTNLSQLIDDLDYSDKNVNSSEFSFILLNVSQLNYKVLSYWNNITNRPNELSDFTDDLGNRGYTSLSNFSNDMGYFNNITNFTGILTNGLFCTYNGTSNKIDCNSIATAGINYTHLSNFTDDLGNRGYNSLSNFTNDMGFINATYGNATYLLVNDQRYNETIRIDTLNSSKLNLNQSIEQIITDGIPLLQSSRNITENNHLVDKLYVDTLVSSFGSRYYMTNVTSGSYKIACNLGCPTESFSLTYSGLTDGQYVAGWISPENMSMVKLIAGVYDWHIFAARTVGTKDLRIYWQLVEMLGNGTEIIIATSATSDLITVKRELKVTLLLNEDYTLYNSSSRIVGKIYAVVGTTGSAPALTLYGGGVDNSHWEIPINLEILDAVYLGIDDQRYNDTSLIRSYTSLSNFSNDMDFINSSYGNNTYLKLSGGTVTGNVSINNTLYVTTTGNVGIGTSSPSSRLTVIGDVNATNFIGNLNWTYLQNYPTACPANTFVTTIGDTITCTQATYEGLAGTPQNAGWYNISTQTITNNSVLINNNLNVTGTVYANNISSNSPLQLQTSGTTRMYINDSIGNIGIGTNIPLAPLQIGLDGVVAPISIGDLTPKLLIISNITSNETETSLLRLVRPTWVDYLFPASVDFKMKSYNSNPGPSSIFAPKTQLTIGLKDSGSLDTSSVVDVMTLQSGGNVGIGTTSPKTILHIQDDVPIITLSDTVESNKKFDIAVDADFSGTSNVGLFFRNNDDAIKMIIQHDGNVGIGTNTPSQKLDVDGNVNVSGTVYANNISSNSPLQLQTSGTTRMYINDSNGYVGIGTTIPLASLQVGLDITAQPISIGDLTPQLLIVGNITSNETESSLLRLVRPTWVDYLYPASVDFKMKSYNTNPGVPSIYAPKTQLTIGLKDSGDLDTSSVVEVMTLQSGGNVGIGTNTPSQKLDVDGNVNISGTVYGQTGNFNKTNSKILSAGIGTPSNIYDFQITDGTVNYVEDVSSANRAVFMGTLSEDNIRFFTNSTNDRLFIGKDGNIGIGTSSPNASLETVSTSDTNKDIAIFSLYGASSPSRPYAGILLRAPDVATGITYSLGRIYTKFDTSNFADSRLTLQSSNSSNGLIDTLTLKNGNVGIGTTSPSAKLYVSDSSLTSPSLTYRATASTTLLGGNVELAFGLSGTSPYPYWLQARDSSNASRTLVINPLGGNVGIGTASPTNKLTINHDGAGSDNYVFLKHEQSGSTTGYLASDTGLSALAVRNKTGGDILIAYQSGGIRVNGEITQSVFTQVGSDPMCWDGSGESKIGDCSSARKYKDNITELSTTTSQFMALKPREFNWNENMGDFKDAGFIADEVETATGGMGVRYREDENKNNTKQLTKEQQDYLVSKEQNEKEKSYFASDYRDRTIIAMTVKEVQNLITENNDLKDRVAGLEKDNKDIKEWICHLDDSLTLCK